MGGGDVSTHVCGVLEGVEFNSRVEEMPQRQKTESEASACVKKTQAACMATSTSAADTEWLHKNKKSGVMLGKGARV